MFNNSLQKIGPIVGFFFVVFSINIAIGIPIVAFRESYSGVCPSLTNAVIGLKKKKKRPIVAFVKRHYGTFFIFFIFLFFFNWTFFKKSGLEKKDL